MKERFILFAFDDTEIIAEKVMMLTKIVGKNNIVTDGLKRQIPEVAIRCKKKQWKEIKFKLDLAKTYY